MTNEEFLKSITLQGEEWRPVVGFENAYIISNFGRVVSLSRLVKCSRGFRRIPPRLLKVSPDKDGYLCVYLTKENYDRQYGVHRLIALSFVDNPKPNEYTHVDHIDGNIRNNDITNLRWCTMRMNLEYPIAYSNFCEAMHKRFSGNNPRAKAVVGINIYNHSDILFYTAMSKAEKDGFSQYCIRACCVGITKQHRGYKWMYLSDYKTSHQ